MTEDPLALLRLLQIADSAFPGGGFAFSNGLETLAQENRAQERRRAGGAEMVSDFIAKQLLPRWAGFDRWFLLRAREAGGAPKALIQIDRACEARNTTASLADASRRMGRAALSSHARIGTAGAADYLGEARARRAPGHLPVVQGLIAAALGLSATQACAAAAYQTAGGALSSAVRLGLIGALEAQSVLAALAPRLGALLTQPLDDAPHAFAPYADIAAMRHRAAESRLFAA